MTARALILAALLALLVAWERGLARGDADARRRATGDVGRMLSEEQVKSFDLAALRLVFGDGRPTATYLPAKGTWRCLEAFAAPADTQAIDALLGAVTRAEGYVLSDEPDQAASYGIGTRDGVRLEICGRDVLRDQVGHDLQWSVDIGRSRPDGDGAFLRPAGTAEIWAVDQDPRALLEAATLPGLAQPLLDPTLCSKQWLSEARSVARLFVDRADGSSFELFLRPREVSEEELRQGVPPYEWILDPDGEALVLPEGRASAYVYCVQQAGFRGLLDPRRAEELGLAGPHDKLTLFPADDEAQPLELHFLPPLAEGAAGALAGGIPVANVLVDMLYEVDPAKAALLMPARAELADASAPNPWQAELERAEGGAK